MARAILTDNQQLHCWELLRRGCVKYTGGDASGCRALVKSRTEPGVEHEVTIEVDPRRHRLNIQCTCKLQEHRPSWWCSHLAATYIIWRANENGNR